MLRKLRSYYPPPEWRPAVIFVLAIGTGLSWYLFYISNAVSYLSDDPSACVNCHIMSPQYATWSKSSHAQVTNCNDCHVPQDNMFRKYLFKGSDGLRHATMFTLRLEPQVIRIHEAGAKVVYENCVRCHNGLNERVFHATGLTEWQGKNQCISCHQETPHGRVNSLSSTPFARYPAPNAITPPWLDNLLKPSPTLKGSQNETTD